MTSLEYRNRNIERAPKRLDLVLKHTQTGWLLLTALVVLLLSGPAAQDAAAETSPPNYFWQKEGVTLSSNVGFGVTLSSATIKLRTEVLGAKATITCKGAEMKNGVIFNGSSRLGSRVGRALGEFVLTTCTTNVCGQVVGGVIKSPAIGEGDYVVVADAKTAGEVLKPMLISCHLDRCSRNSPLRKGRAVRVS